jgi:HSP20 family protein
MQRLSEDMDRLFENFFNGGFGAGLAPLENRLSYFAESAWPAIDVFARDGKLIVQADVPGLDKKDLNVEVRDHQLCISGERRSEVRSQEADYVRTERSYGSFFRGVPLPEGAKVDTASAKFENGVLRVEVEVPPTPAPRGRRVEVR